NIPAAGHMSRVIGSARRPDKRVGRAAARRSVAAGAAAGLYRDAAFAMNERTQGDRFVMKDLSAAERRLIAALDRMDHAVERAARRMAELGAAATAPALAPSVPGTDVSAEVAALHDRQAATV